MVLPGAGAPPSPPAAVGLFVFGAVLLWLQLLLTAGLLGLAGGREGGGEIGTELGCMPG